MTSIAAAFANIMIQSVPPIVSKTEQTRRFKKKTPTFVTISDQVQTPSIVEEQ